MNANCDKQVIILGDNEIGKTTLAAKLADSEVSVGELSTLGLTERALDNGISIIDFGGELGVSPISEDRKPSAILYVISSGNDNKEANIAKWLDLTSPKHQLAGLPKFLAISKIDLSNAYHPAINNGIFHKFEFDGVYSTSSLTGEGIQELKKNILDRIKIFDEESDENGLVSVIVTTMVDGLCQLVAKNWKNLYNIEWRDLERMIAHIFDTLGFKSHLTTSSKDGGKDIVLNCMIENEANKYYIEVKHRKGSNRVGEKYVSAFIEVNMIDRTSGGLFLSTTGFTKTVHTMRAKITRQKIRLGDKEKIISLCSKYTLAKNGMLCTKTPLQEILFEETW